MSGCLLGVPCTLSCLNITPLPSHAATLPLLNPEQHLAPCTPHAATRPTSLPQINALTGTIPPDLCDAASPLRALNLRGNQLTGAATPVTRCHQLATLDLSFNQLTGRMPATKVGWMGIGSLSCCCLELTGVDSV